MTKSKLSSHKTQFLQHLLSVAQRYRTSAIDKVGLSNDRSDDAWGINIWLDNLRRVQFSAASEFDGPEVTNEFISITDLRNEISARGVKTFDKPQKKKYNSRRH